MDDVSVRESTQGAETDSLQQERIRLSNEWHARPNIIMAPPFRCTHIVNLRDGETEEHAWQEITRFCTQQGQSGPAAGSRYHLTQIGSCLLKWESHTEATSHTIVIPGTSQPPFGETAIDLLDADKQEQLLSDLFVGVHVEVLQDPGDSDPGGYELARSVLGSQTIYGGAMSGGLAPVWSAFRLDARGFVRIVIIDRGINERRLARLLQRLLDMESYRMLAMRTLPTARAVMATLQELEPRLHRVMRELAENSDDAARETALHQITEIAAKVEQIAASHSSRFGGARAYASIVERRIEEVREEIIGGQQRYTNFLMRALAPAMRTCDAAEKRVGELAERVSRSANLLSTMVNIEQSHQSHGILTSLAKSSKLQVRLQQAVEGFSIFAISYYAVGLIKYALTSAQVAGLPVNSDLLAGLSAPLIFALVYLSIRFVRRRLLARNAGDTEP